MEITKLNGYIFINSEGLAYTKDELRLIALGYCAGKKLKLIGEIEFTEEYYKSKIAVRLDNHLEAS